MRRGEHRIHTPHASDPRSGRCDRAAAPTSRQRVPRRGPATDEQQHASRLVPSLASRETEARHRAVGADDCFRPSCRHKWRERFGDAGPVRVPAETSAAVDRFVTPSEASRERDSDALLISIAPHARPQAPGPPDACRFRNTHSHMPVSNRGAPTHEHLQLDGLDLQELLQSEAAQLAAVTGLLVAAERGQGIEGGAVDVDLPGTQPPRQRPGTPLVG